MALTVTQGDNYRLAVVIGRFQIFHHGHLALLEQALGLARQVVVVIGSAYQARDGKNPFSWQERREFICAALTKEQVARLLFLPLRDYFSMPHWCAALTTKVEQLAQNRGILPSQIALVGHFKDSTSSYLAHFPCWELIELAAVRSSDGAAQGATELRQLFFTKPTSSQLRTSVPPAVYVKLLLWQQTELYRQVRKYWQYANDNSVSRDVQLSYKVCLLLSVAGEVALQQQRSPASSADLAVPGITFTHQQQLAAKLVKLLELFGLSVVGAQPQKIAEFAHPQRLLVGHEKAYLYRLNLEQKPLTATLPNLVWLAESTILAQPQRMADDGLHMLLTALGTDI